VDRGSPTARKFLEFSLPLPGGGCHYFGSSTTPPKSMKEADKYHVLYNIPGDDKMLACISIMGKLFVSESAH
jgi:hypothetical protein